MFFGCTVVSTMTRLRSDGFMAPVRVATARLSCSKASRAELLFQEGPVDRPRKLRQLVVQVDDLDRQRFCPSAKTVTGAAVASAILPPGGRFPCGFDRFSDAPHLVSTEIVEIA
jgi:hypothetical protein